MTIISTTIQPFVMNQTLYVYQDDVQISEHYSTIATFLDSVLTLAKNNSAEKVILSGPKKFITGAKGELERFRNKNYPELSSLEIECK